MPNAEFTESTEDTECKETAETISGYLRDGTLDGRCAAPKQFPGTCSGERVFSFWRKIS
jgi:hypothetical protein